MICFLDDTPPAKKYDGDQKTLIELLSRALVQSYSAAFMDTSLTIYPNDMWSVIVLSFSPQMSTALFLPPNKNSKSKHRHQSYGPGLSLVFAGWEKQHMNRPSEFERFEPWNGSLKPWTRPLALPDPTHGPSDSTTAFGSEKAWSPRPSRPF